MDRKFVPGLVSVITPVYNAEKFIGQTIESVFNQTYKNLELILVDDVSTDRSVEIIKEYGEEHSEIVYFLQTENSGAGVARNKALEIAKGQYVAFLDADDLWVPEKTERQIQLMRRKNSSFSYAAIEMIDEFGKMVKGKRSIKESCDYKYLLQNTIIATSSVIVDRNVFGDFRMSSRRGGQDYATWLSLLRNGTVACGINETMVKYRVGNDSLSSNKFKSIKQVWEIQTRDEGIGKISAAFHVMCFAFNALKKYLV